MRLYCQVPIMMDLDNPSIKRYLGIVKKWHDKVKREDTQIDIYPLTKGICNIKQLDYPGMRFLNDRELLLDMLEAESKGYDGIIDMCYFDPALRAARQVLNIPVVGCSESSMHLAAFMGRRFATITSNAHYVQGIEENVYKYGLQELAIFHLPVRAIDISGDDFINSFMSGDYSMILKSFKEIAVGCINDGAEVLIAGCGLLSPLLTDEGVLGVEGVPVIDPMLAAIKFGELMVDLCKAGLPFVSRKGLYFKAPNSELKDFLKGSFNR